MKKLNQFIQKAEVFIGSVLIATIFFVSAVQIVFRYFLRRPLGWTNEVACYSLVWVTFLTLANLYSTRRHVSLTLLTNHFSERTSHIVNICCSVLVAVGMIILLPSCIGNMKFMILSPALKIPQQYIYVIIPISFFLIIFHSIVLVMEDVEALKGKEA